MNLLLTVINRAGRLKTMFSQIAKVRVLPHIRWMCVVGCVPRNR